MASPASNRYIFPVPDRSGFKHNLYIVLALAALTLLLYWPATGFDFTNYDDLAYVTGNPVVQNGLTWTGIKWAFETNWSSNWHPLTWISHMLDCSFYGLNPGGHHFTNILFHTANSILVFLALLRLTSSRWRSALVAALFAWHPLHVESAAWIAERKDLLSAFFWFLAMWAYADYAKPAHPAAKPKPLYRNGAYWLTFLLVACGLLAKPMVVTLPFVFMLMDLWPLQRVALWPGKNNSDVQNPAAQISIPEWIIEKIPFFGLSALDCVATFWAQKDSNAVIGTASLPWGMRLSNALTSYENYLGKIFWPAGLAVHYPFSSAHTVRILSALALLIGITLAALSQRRARGFLLIGWLWFLGTLIPVIGLVQVGTQSMADRYTYIPATGIFIMVAWMLPEKWFQWPRPGLVTAVVTGGILIGAMTLAEMQLQYWRNSITLFGHAVQVSKNDLLSEYNLGEALTHENFLDAAIPHFQRVLMVTPNRAELNFDAAGHAHYNLGLIYRAQKHWSLAEPEFRAFIRAEPQAATGHVNLGVTLVAQDRPQEGLAEFRMTAARNGRNPAEAEVIALSEVDAAYAEAGKLDQATTAIQQTLQRAKASGNKTLIETTEQRMTFYRKEMAKKK